MDYWIQWAFVSGGMRFFDFSTFYGSINLLYNYELSREVNSNIFNTIHKKSVHPWLKKTRFALRFAAQLPPAV